MNQYDFVNSPAYLALVCFDFSKLYKMFTDLESCIRLS